MINENVSSVLMDMREIPNKYIRVYIRGGKGIIAFPDGNKMQLKRALFAELQGDQAAYADSFDEDNCNDFSLNFMLGVKKQKKLAYAAGRGNELKNAGYIACHAKKDDEGNAYNEVPVSKNSSEKLFCGVFTTVNFTFILACSENHNQMFYQELVRMDNQPDIQDIICRLSTCFTSNPSEVNHVKEE